MSNAKGEFLVIENLTHRYGSFAALHEVCLSVEEGQFVTLLGPSGCGKTTLLRSVAGFLRPTEGKIRFQGRDISGTPAHRRPFNMVFQRPTMFPHLDVFGNIAFGLRMRRTPRSERTQRVSDVIALVHLGGLERRRSHELSGGQLQRVCLARALVNQPRLLLLDEPLSALDRRIKLEMQAELRRIHRETGCAFLYVTHDQQEAMAMSDRVALLNQGEIAQEGTPSEIYAHPASAFAARFVDANVIAATVLHGDDREVDVIVGEATLRVLTPHPLSPGEAWLVIRPEAIQLTRQGWRSKTTASGVVLDVSFRGSGYSYQVDVRGLHEPVKVDVPAPALAFSVGNQVQVEFDEAACTALAREETKHVGGQ